MASSGQPVMINDTGGFGHPGFGHPGFFHGLVSPEHERQDPCDFIYDTPRKSWNTSTYLPNTMQDNTLISPFATAFDQASLMAQVYPNAEADMSGDAYQTATAVDDQQGVQPWNPNGINNTPPQGFVPPAGMSWGVRSPPQDIATSQRHSYSSPVRFQPPVYASRDSSEQVLSASISTEPIAKGKGAKKRRNTDTTNNESGRRRNSHATKRESKRRRPSVVTPMIEDTSSIRIKPPMTPRIEKSRNTRPQPSRRVSDMSQPSNISHPSPETTFSYSTQDIKTPDTDIEDLPEERTQRERNRAAATKCRAKNKRAISELEESSRAVTEQREFLSAYAASLKNEVLALKNELLQHGDCDCVLIQTYLSNMARKVGESTTG